jgi:hypothetical protein
VLGLLAGLALAGEQIVPIPFVPPASVPLFVSAEVVTVRGSVKTDDCAGATEAALAALAERGTVVRLTVSKDDLAVADRAVCRQRIAGDHVSASVVDLSAFVVTPGAPPSVYPPMTPDRIVQVAAIVGAITGGGITAATIDDLDGRAWVRMGRMTIEGPLDQRRYDENGRAIAAYERVPQWVSGWAKVLESVPEVSGAILEVEVVSEDPTVKKSRVVELFRFVVPTGPAREFLRGATNDVQFLGAARVDRATDPKRRNFERFAIDLESLAPEPTESLTVRVEPLPADELEGVEDEPER